MIKLAIIISGLETGGAEKFVADLASRINKEKFEVVVYYGREQASENLIKTIVDGGAKAKCINFSGKSKVEAKQIVEKAFDEYKPDIIHANLICHRYCTRWAKKNKVKIIRTIHHDIKTEMDIKNKFIAFLAYHRNIIIPVCLSDKMKKDFSKTYLKKKNVYVINNGVDLSKFEPKNQTKEFDFVFVGRLAEVKNVPLLLNAFKKCYLSNNNLKLAIAGDGPLYNRLQQLAKDLNIANAVDFLGDVNDVPSILSKSKIFVLPSFSEGFSIATIDAIAMGLPVISTASGGPETIIKNNGFIVKNNDVDALAEKMHLLITDESIYREFSQNSLELKELYNVRKMVEKYENLYVKFSNKKTKEVNMDTNLKISVRLDDICPTMNWTNFYKVMELCEKYGVKPLLGVVPDNQDKKLVVDNNNQNFFQVMRNLQEKGVSFAQHGLDHVYRNHKGGILKLNKNSDFVGLSKEEQKELLKQGLEILKKENIRTEIYMAPSHSYDKNTILALNELGFKYVTDGYTNFNYLWHGLKFIPCMHTFKIRKEVSGICTLCLHINTMSEDDLQEFENTLKKYEKSLCDYSELLQEPAKKRFKIKQKYNLFITKAKVKVCKMLKALKIKK